MSKKGRRNAKTSAATREYHGSFGKKGGTLRPIMNARSNLERDVLLEYAGTNPLLRDNEVEEIFNAAGFPPGCNIKEFSMVCEAITRDQANKREKDKLVDGRRPDEAIMNAAGGPVRYWTYLEGYVDIVMTDLAETA